MKELLTKTTWTDEDFEMMGWHDSCVHQWSFDKESNELLLDIDYIIKWVDPAPSSTDNSFSFWVSPATLVFENVTDIMPNPNDMVKPFEIVNIDRVKAEGDTYRWIFEAYPYDESTSDDLGIQFTSTGYTQYIRKAPSLTKHQKLSLIERNGLSYAKSGYDNDPS